MKGNCRILFYFFTTCFIFLVVVDVVQSKMMNLWFYFRNKNNCWYKFFIIFKVRNICIDLYNSLFGGFGGGQRKKKEKNTAERKITLIFFQGIV